MGVNLEFQLIKGTTAAYRVPRLVRAMERAQLLSPTPHCPRYRPQARLSRYRRPWPP